MFEKAGSSYEKESFPKGVYPVVVEDIEPYEFEGVNEKTGQPETKKRISWKLRIRDGHAMAGKLMETSGPRYLTEQNRSGKIIGAILGEIPSEPSSINIEKQIKGQKLHVQWDHGEFRGNSYEGVEGAFRLPADEEGGNPPPVPAGNVENDQDFDEIPF